MSAERAVPIIPIDDVEVAKDCPMDGHGRNICVGLEVNDADALYEEWRKRVPIDRPPMNEDWGARTFSLTDPFGNGLFVMGPLEQCR